MVQARHVLMLAILGKIAFVEYINYTLYREINGKALGREDTLKLIDERIAELQKSVDGSAGMYVRPVMDELRKLRETIANSPDKPSDTIQDYVNKVSSRADDALDDMAEASGDLIDRMSETLSESWQTVSYRFSRAFRILIGEEDTKKSDKKDTVE